MRYVPGCVLILSPKPATTDSLTQCYIGHRSLERAIQLFQKTYPGASKDQIIFSFHPFYRSPDAPTVGIPWEEAVDRKNGPERVHAIRTRMERVGRESGILFSFNSKIGSTRDCHRMFRHFATPKGWEAEKALIEKIFEAHFERNADITSHSVLAEMAKAAGVVEDESEVLEFLAGGQAGTKIDRLVEEARKRGVRHVPTFEIGGSRVEGAEEAWGFYEALVAAKEGVGEYNGGAKGALAAERCGNN